jgi:hypothetical protein
MKRLVDERMARLCDNLIKKNRVAKIRKKTTHILIHCSKYASKTKWY